MQTLPKAEEVVVRRPHLCRGQRVVVVPLEDVGGVRIVSKMGIALVL